jgi:hypothetical protein
MDDYIAHGTVLTVLIGAIGVLANLATIWPCFDKAAGFFKSS